MRQILWILHEIFEKNWKETHLILIGREETFDKIWQLLMTNLLTDEECKGIHSKSIAHSWANDEILKALLLNSEVKWLLLSLLFHKKLKVLDNSIRHKEIKHTEIEK